MTLDELADLHGQHASDVQRELRTLISTDLLLRLADLVASTEAFFEVMQPAASGTLRNACCRSAFDLLGVTDELVDRMKAARDAELGSDRPKARN